jgi:glycosyltransferase involved in cell wall biosynthesis
MRIAFNAQLLSEPHSGSGRYIFNLLDALGQLDTMNQYFILSAQQLSVRPESPANFVWETEPIRGPKIRPGIEKLLWEQRAFPGAARKLDADLLHTPYFGPPRRTFRLPSVVTILDVIPQRLPAYQDSFSERAFARLAEQASRQASAVIAISNHCKQDIVETLHIPANRITVTYLAPDPRLRPASLEAQQEIRHRLGLHGPFILNVGGMDARKNIAGLIQAFAEVYRQFGNPDLRLFITGNPAKLGSDVIFPDWRPLAEKLGVTDKLMCTPVAEEDLATLYSAADCFAFTSLYEGFGLTPLEAMACGAPVVCSNATSLPEVVGDAGILVDPLNIPALSAAILEVLRNPALSQDLRRKSLEQAARFTWDRTASETLAVYKEVVSSAARASH